MLRDLVWLALGILFYGLLITYLVGLIPAAVLMARRKSWAYFWAGFVTFGLAWFFGTLQILYFRKRTILIVAAAILVVGFIGARPAVLFGVDGETLQTSVGTFLTDSSECEARGVDWVCSRYDDGASGAVEYLVEVDALGCWKGKSLMPNYSSDRTIEGCINLIDVR